MRGAVVHAQRAGPATNVHAQSLPRERLLEDPLAEIARDGEPITSQVLTGLFTCSKKVQSQADILSGDYIVKLKRETMDGIEAAIRREGHIVGKGGFLVGAKAILDLLNKGKRNRLTFD